MTDHGEQLEASATNGTPDGLRLNVAFWNLQNLFDIEASPIATDLDYTPVNGWDRRALEAKIGNIAQIIRSMFDGYGPDLLGLCEIENERLARILIEAIGRDDFALAVDAGRSDLSSPSGESYRALDTALIYSKRLLEPAAQGSTGHVVHRRYPTRDIFEAHFKVRANDSELMVLVNHWPSRSADAHLSESLRISVADYCARLIDGHLKLSRREYLQLRQTELSLLHLNSAWDRNILLMGDFNDEPWDRSVREVLRGSYSQHALSEPIRMVQDHLPSFRSYSAMPPTLFNPMWSLVHQPDCGTWRDPEDHQPMKLRDQFLISRGLYFGLQGLKLATASPGIPAVEVFKPESLCERHGGPKAFRTDTRTGFSDHFPILTSLNIASEDAAE